MAEKKRNSRILLLVLGIISLAGTVALYFYVRWLAHFVGEVSTSVESNALYFLGWMGVFLVVVCAEAVFVRDFHRFMRRDEERVKVSGRNEVALEIKRRIKETRILWTVYIGAPVLLNLLLLNFLSGGFLFSGMGGFSQYATIATMLRSDDKGEQLTGIEAAVASSDRRLGKYLAKIVEKKGEMSEMAAWAAGMRKDHVAREAIRSLYIEGDKKKRAMSIIALSELGDYKIMGKALEDLRGGKEPGMNLIIAMGNLPYLAAEDTLVEMAGDEELSEPVRAACFWAISKIEQERFKQAWERDSRTFGYDAGKWQAPARKGWEPMIPALKCKSLVLKCAAVQALRYAGPVEVSKDLMEAFEAAEKFENCKRLAVKPYQYRIFEVVQSELFRSSVIRALSGIGDKSVVGWLDTVGDDRENADEVILLARDLARQIKQLK